jgi:hypothetical protein
LFACPVCHEPLFVEGHSFVCANAHRYDLAKKGTINFLNAPVKTEYTAEMLAARRRVLQAGLIFTVCRPDRGATSAGMNACWTSVAAKGRRQQI